MSAPIPKSKANELLGNFADLIRERKHADELTLARFARDARAEIKHDPAPAYTLLGAVYACQINIEEMHRCHKAAIHLRDNEETRGNYAVSLQLIGLLQEAAEQAVIVSEMTPENLTLLDRAIYYCWMAGRLDQAQELCKISEKRGRKEEEQMRLNTEAAEILKRRGIDQKEYQDSIEIAYETLRQSMLISPEYQVELDSERGDESILYRMLISAPQEAIDVAQARLAVRLAEKLGDRWFPEFMMFEYSSCQ